jgi:hypothetical protein
MSSDEDRPIWAEHADDDDGPQTIPEDGQAQAGAPGPNPNRGDDQRSPVPGDRDGGDD